MGRGGTGIISCNTDIEALDIVVPDNMSEEYWENLRAYKARNDHEVFFGWFGGWTANSADMINFLSSVPDSVDIISIWGEKEEKYMINLTFGEQVKIVLSRKDMTIKELAEEIEARTGKKMSRQNLTQRLGRDNFQEQDMRIV